MADPEFDFEAQVDEAFYEALQLSPEQRLEFLQRCSADLRAAVENLLQAEEQVRDNFLEPPAPLSDRSASLATDVPGAAGPPKQPPLPQIPGYQLLEKIGEGGMGIVYEAIQDPPMVRRVAIKVLQNHARGGAMLARYRAEQESGAVLDHPNIARMFDAGLTAEGLPYFIIEYVDGIPITKFCDLHQMTVKQRLKLMESLCDALQHAHQKGFIHRDLKPSNILVTGNKENPIVKVIDFGMAKALQAIETDAAVDNRTQPGDVMGTLFYMSPEQAAGRTHDADTRADVYSLGIILFELLTGTTPVNADRVGQRTKGAILEMIAHDDPPLPSQRLRELEKKTDSIADARSIDSRSLVASVSGEIDWIVQKSIEVDRDRRYATPLELSQEIRRYLNNDLVLAGPHSRRYRLKKFVHRHRSTVAFATSLASLLIVATIGLSILSWQLNKETVRANQALQQSQQLARNLEQERDHARQLLEEISDRDEKLLQQNQKLQDTIAQGFIVLDAQFGSSQDPVLMLMESLSQAPIPSIDDLDSPDLDSSDSDPTQAKKLARQICFDAFTHFVALLKNANELTATGNSATDSTASQVIQRYLYVRAAVNRALQLDPELGFAHLLRTELDSKISEYSQKLSSTLPFNPLTSLLPTNDQILEQWNTTVATLPRSTHAFCGRGYWHFVGQSYTEAEIDFLRAVELDPQNDLALRGLARLYEATGDYQQAVDYFRKAFHSPESFFTTITNRPNDNYYPHQVAALTWKHLWDSTVPLHDQIPVTAVIRHYGAYSPDMLPHTTEIWETIVQAFEAADSSEAYGILKFVIADQRFDKSTESYNATRDYLQLLAEVCRSLHPQGTASPQEQQQLLTTLQKAIERNASVGWKSELSLDQLQRLKNICLRQAEGSEEHRELLESFIKQARFVSIELQPLPNP